MKWKNEMKWKKKNFFFQILCAACGDSFWSLKFNVPNVPSQGTWFDLSSPTGDVRELKMTIFSLTRKNPNPDPKSKRRRFTSTEITPTPPPKLDSEKLMDFGSETEDETTQTNPFGNAVFHLPSEFKLLFSGLEIFQIPCYKNLSGLIGLQLGNFARGVACNVENYDKLLDGEAPLRHENIKNLHIDLIL